MMRMVMRMRRMMVVVFVVVLKKSVIARVYMRVTMCGIFVMGMLMLVHIFLYMVVILAVMAMRVFLHMRMCMHVMVMFVVVLMYMVMFMVVLMRMVMFVVIFMRMRMPTWHRLFLLAMNQHPHMRAGNAALCARLCFKNHTRDSHGIQFGKRGFLIRHQFQKSCGQHIARRPHRTFDI